MTRTRVIMTSMIIGYVQVTGLYRVLDTVTTNYFTSKVPFKSLNNVTM